MLAESQDEGRPALEEWERCRTRVLSADRGSEGGSQDEESGSIVFCQGGDDRLLALHIDGRRRAQVASPVSSGDPSAAPSGSASGRAWTKNYGDRPVRVAVGNGSAASAGAVRQDVPADAAPQPPAPATQPPQGAGPPMVEPGAPGSNTSDLSLPASEKAFGGGEPTTSAAAAEEAAAEEEKKDSRGLLMKSFDVPEDAGWRIFGWIQNSYTGNANGFGNGHQLRRQPELQGQLVDGEPVLPHLREAAEAG